MSRVFSSSSASGERLADEFIQLGIHRGDFRSAEFIPLHFADKRGVLELGRALVFTQALKRTEAFQFPVGKRKKESNWASLGCANELKNSDCKWLITKEPPNRYLEVRAARAMREMGCAAAHPYRCWVGRRCRAAHTSIEVLCVRQDSCGGNTGQDALSYCCPATANGPGSPSPSAPGHQRFPAPSSRSFPPTSALWLPGGHDQKWSIPQ